MKSCHLLAAIIDICSTQTLFNYSSLHVYTSSKCACDVLLCLALDALLLVL